MNIVILDACRNNPFARSFRSVSRGLAHMSAPYGTLLAYATAPGAVAADGDGDNGPLHQRTADRDQDPRASRRGRVQARAPQGPQEVPWKAGALGVDVDRGRLLFRAGKAGAAEAGRGPEGAGDQPHPAAGRLRDALEVAFWTRSRTANTRPTTTPISGGSRKARSPPRHARSFRPSSPRPANREAGAQAQDTARGPGQDRDQGGRADRQSAAFQHPGDGAQFRLAGPRDDAIAADAQRRRRRHDPQRQRGDRDRQDARLGLVPRRSRARPRRFRAGPPDRPRRRQRDRPLGARQAQAATRGTSAASGRSIRAASSPRSPRPARTSCGDARGRRRRSTPRASPDRRRRRSSRSRSEAGEAFREVWGETKSAFGSAMNFFSGKKSKPKPPPPAQSAGGRSGTAGGPRGASVDILRARTATSA